MRTRQIMLAAVLVLTLGATWWAASVPEERAPARKGAGRPAVAAVAAGPAREGARAGGNERGEAVSAVPRLTPEQYKRPAWTESPATRVALAWGPPPPPPPPVLPKGYKPPPPPPPPLPFRAIGKLEDGAAVTAFLLGGDRTYAVRPGDMIDSSYRVEEVTPRHVIFTFLPLKIRQELSLEGPQ